MSILLPAMSQVEADWNAGSVSFLSSRNVYVKFESTEEIASGDTLYVRENELFTPALLVVNKSSSSVVCTPLEGVQMEVKQVVYARKRMLVEEKKEEAVDPARQTDEPTSTAEIEPSFSEEETIFVIILACDCDGH